MQAYSSGKFNAESLEEKIGYKFKNKGLLVQALTHISYAKESGGSHYEVLEFLGDAIVNFIIVDILVKNFPRKREGTLAPLKAFLISEDFLSELAKELDLQNYIRLSKREHLKGTRNNISIMSDVFEALWASIYIDCNRDANLVKDIFAKLFEKKIIQTVREQRIRKDYKSLLQEITQGRWKEKPVYRVIKMEGPEHDKIFTVECMIREYRAIGTGKSKKDAEQKAAERMIELLS